MLSEKEKLEQELKLLKESLSLDVITKKEFENAKQRIEERLEALEKTALSFPGVKRVYALQAGREIRIFVKPEEIDDLKAKKLAREIADKIETELKYPGEIKVTVIRENRITEYAR